MQPDAYFERAAPVLNHAALAPNVAPAVVVGARQ
jgi:hypothetical protein